MVSLCSHMTDGASSLQRRAFGNRRKRRGQAEGEGGFESMLCHSVQVTVYIYIYIKVTICKALPIRGCVTAGNVQL